MSRNHADVIIIGGGIIGCNIAYDLAKRNAKSLVIDKASAVGTEASWAGAGILTSHASTHEPYPTLCRASLARYPGLAKELRAETQIDIELIESGTLSVFFNSAEAARINRSRRSACEARLLSGSADTGRSMAVRACPLKIYRGCRAVS